MSELREFAEQIGVNLFDWQLDMLGALIENQHPVYVVLKKGNGRKEAKRLAREFVRCFEATLGKKEWICRDESGGDPCLFICSYCDAEFNHPEDEPINYCPNCGRRVRA